MKKILLPLFISVVSMGAVFAQTVATDFTANDCFGTSHHLFSELDAGKVVVISFVEPCASCIGPSGNALVSVQNVMAANPAAQVVFYISSDFGTYPCSSLGPWAVHNGLGSSNAYFSDPALVTTQYGPNPYMPKIVVLGGPGHKVFLNAEGATLDTTTIQSAITSALVSTGVPLVTAGSGLMRVDPNPARESLTFSYDLPQTSDITISIYNLIGTRVFSYSRERQSVGAHELPINLGTNVSSGIYFVKLSANGNTRVQKFIVEK